VSTRRTRSSREGSKGSDSRTASQSSCADRGSAMTFSLVVDAGSIFQVTHARRNVRAQRCAARYSRLHRRANRSVNRLSGRTQLEAGGRLLLGRLDPNLVHARRGRAAARPRDQFFFFLRRTVDQRLDAAVAAIWRPAGHAEPFGFFPQRITVAHALHPAVDPQSFRHHVKNLKETLQPSELAS